jgi:hypothetical protein
MLFISVGVGTLISSKIWTSQAKNRQAKLLVWRFVRRPMSHGEGKDSVCFERGARMDSFAAMLTTLGRSSMYEIMF